MCMTSGVLTVPKHLNASGGGRGGEGCRAPSEEGRGRCMEDATAAAGLLFTCMCNVY